jgi:hypothetical protein
MSISDRPRCSARTKAGPLCEKAALEGEAFCEIHSGRVGDVRELGRRGGLKRVGRRLCDRCGSVLKMLEVCECADVRAAAEPARDGAADLAGWGGPEVAAGGASGTGTSASQKVLVRVDPPLPEAVSEGVPNPRGEESAPDPAVLDAEADAEPEPDAEAVAEPRRRCGTCGAKMRNADVRLKDSLGRCRGCARQNAACRRLAGVRPVACRLTSGSDRRGSAQDQGGGG